MLKQISNFRSLNRQAFALGITTSSPSEFYDSNRYENIRNLNSHATSRSWDLLSAVCLERHPVITKPLEGIEAKFREYLRQVEFENSMRSDFEIRDANEKKEQQLQKQIEIKSNTDIVFKQTAQDLEDLYEAELAKFQFAPRINDQKSEDTETSLTRKFDRNLLLLVEQQLGNKTYWIPPQSIRKDGETMRQAAERTLQEICGEKLKVQFYGNAPIGFYKYKYPKELCNKGRYGAKIFYYLAKYKDGTVSPNTKHRWLDRDELNKTLHPAVHKSVSQFLLPD